MKIESFTIQSIRGIHQFGAEVGSKTIVVTGPNGTGKSGVVDAFDFLFSGNIQRLTGAGTKELSLDTHGKHIDDELSDSFVSSVLELENGNKVEVKRALSDKMLICIQS